MKEFPNVAGCDALGSTGVSGSSPGICAVSHWFPKEYSGFTLAEMLVVLAVLGILAAMAVAVSGDVQTRAYDAVVVSELRRAEQVSEAYYDSHGSYPASMAAAGFRAAGGVVFDEWELEADAGRSLYLEAGHEASGNRWYVDYPDGSGIRRVLRETIGTPRLHEVPSAERIEP